jgi:hypothetical protein
MMACSGGVISNQRSPSRGRVGEKERGGREGGIQGEEERGMWLVVCSLLSLGPPLYSGEGEHQPLHQGSPRAAAKGRGGAARAGPAGPPKP